MLVSVVTTCPVPVTVATALAWPAALPALAQRHQRGSRHPDGQHRLHRRRGHDGGPGSAGGWRLAMSQPHSTPTRSSVFGW